MSIYFVSFVDKQQRRKLIDIPRLRDAYLYSVYTSKCRLKYQNHKILIESIVNQSMYNKTFNKKSTQSKTKQKCSYQYIKCRFKLKYSKIYRHRNRSQVIAVLKRRNFPCTHLRIAGKEHHVQWLDNSTPRQCHGPHTGPFCAWIGPVHSHFHARIGHPN